MIKLVIRLGVMLVLILIGLVVILTISLGRVVRNGVVTVGPEITQTSVQLGGAKLSVLSGSGELSGLVIGNPDGFNTPSAVEVGQAKLVLKPRSVLSDKVVVRSIQLHDPVITFEGGLRGNNLKALLDNIQQSAGSGGEPAPASEREGKKLQVDEFFIHGAKLNLSLSVLPGQIATVSLPDIELRDLGQGPEGITSAELSQRILHLVLQEATEAATAYLGEHGAGAAERALDFLKKNQ